MVDYYMKLIWPQVFENMEIRRPNIPKNWELYLDGSNNPGWDVRNIDEDFRTEVLRSNSDNIVYDPLIHMTGEELQAWIKIVRSKVFGISKSIDPLEAIAAKEEMLKDSFLNQLTQANLQDIDTFVDNQMTQITNLAGAKVLLGKILKLNLFLLKILIGK